MTIDCHLDWLAIQILKHLDPGLSGQDALDDLGSLIVDLSIGGGQEGEEEQGDDEHEDP